MGLADIVMSSQEEIECMLDEDRYNPEIVPTLEKYLKSQASGDTYDLDANLALLKFYQFQPATANLEMVQMALAKSLMHLPSSDFSLCLYLLPETVIQDEKVKSLMQLAKTLEAADFPKFWEQRKALDSVLKAVPKFDDAVRKFVMATLSISYARIPKQTLCQALNMKQADLKSAPGAELYANFDEKNDVVEFAENEQNRFKSKPTEQLEDYSTVFSKVLYSSAVTSEAS